MFFSRPRACGLSGGGARVTLSGRVLEALWPTLRLLVLALVLGRILLSFLPAGEPGGHSLRKLPATAAASLVLGAGLLLGLSFVSDDPWLPALGLGAAGGLLRWATRPAGIVPRHELPREGGRWLSRLLYLGALVPAFLRWPQGETDQAELASLEIVHRLALLVLLVGVEHGLAIARRAPLARRFLVLGLSLCLFRENGNTRSISELVERIDAACWSCGAAFALAWLRRADRRSGALAVACFVIGRPWGAFEGALLALAALLALVVCSARPARLWIAAAGAIGLALCLAPALRGMSWTGTQDSGSPLAALLRLALAVAVLSTVAWIGRALAARSRPEPEDDRTALARGDLLLFCLLILATGVGWALPAALGSLEGPADMQLVAPLAFLLAGCVSIRPERAA
jgi:hypothetical protein